LRHCATALKKSVKAKKKGPSRRKKKHSAFVYKKRNKEKRIKKSDFWAAKRKKG
jgi:hypothetical protein